MNILTEFKATIPSLLFAVALAFVLAPAPITAAPTDARSPAYTQPPGGYPGENTAVGTGACYNLLLYRGRDMGQGNAAVGYNTLYSLTTGWDNTAVGDEALEYNTASSNTGIGSHALSSNTTGIGSTATGRNALVNNTVGNFNVANGDEALLLNSTGGGNTAVGYGALESNTTGMMNTALGYYAGWNVSTAYNVICIGSMGGNVNNSTWVDHVYGVTTQSGFTAPVVVSSDGQLGTVASSARFKKDIATMNNASEGILSLRPVSFHYKSDAKETPQFGLIAEEVAKVNPALVLPDKDGKPYTVRYDAVNAMLLNEFLKEHRKGEQQDRKIEQLEATVASLQSALKAQAAQIQKVTDQLSAEAPAPYVVADN